MGPDFIQKSFKAKFPILVAKEEILSLILIQMLKKTSSKIHL